MSVPGQSIDGVPHPTHEILGLSMGPSFGRVPGYGAVATPESPVVALSQGAIGGGVPASGGGDLPAHSVPSGSGAPGTSDFGLGGGVSGGPSRASGLGVESLAGGRPSVGGHRPALQDTTPQHVAMYAPTLYWHPDELPVVPWASDVLEQEVTPTHWEKPFSDWLKAWKKIRGYPGRGSQKRLLIALAQKIARWLKSQFGKLALAELQGEFKDSLIAKDRFLEREGVRESLEDFIRLALGGPSVHGKSMDAAVPVDERMEKLLGIVRDYRRCELDNGQFLVALFDFIVPAGDQRRERETPRHLRYSNPRYERAWHWLSTLWNIAYYDPSSPRFRPKPPTKPLPRR